MLGQFIAKKVAGTVIKKVMEKNAIKKIREYVEEPNDADKRIDELETKVFHLEKLSHEPQEYVCCRKCGCKIAKTKRTKKKNKRRK